MVESKLESYLNEILKDREFFGEPIEEYLQTHYLADTEVLNLDKADLIKLLTKSLVAISALQSDLIESYETYRNDMSATTMAFNEGIDYLKDYSNMVQLNATILKNLPDMMEKKAKQALSNNAKLGSIAKLKNDPKQLILKEIEVLYKSSTYPFHKRGYRAKFCKEMAAKYPIIENIKAIENLFDRLRKSENTKVDN